MLARLLWQYFLAVPSSPKRSLIVACAVLWAAVLWPTTPGLADQSYTVREGDTLARIARRHRIRVSALTAANQIRNGRIRPGQVLRVPEEGVIYVRSGQTLSSIARSNGVSAEALRRQNRLRSNATLRIGQRLLLPGHQAAVAQHEAAERWGRPRSPGIATLIRVQNRQRMRLRLVNRRGRVESRAVRRFAPLMRFRGSSRTKRPDRRLLSMLANVSDHFGGRTIFIVSGYRPPGGHTRPSSRHTRGKAIDFRLERVPNTALRDYCNTLSNAGVGYYPRSSFVHLDTREQSSHWVDWSRPGEAPRYRETDPDLDGEPPGEDTEAPSGTPSEPDDGSNEPPAPTQ